MANDEELRRNWIPHLLGQFQRARPILFTGAGFSVGVRNIRGEPIPSYQELKSRLWSLCFPGKEFDPASSLQDLYDHALLRHKRDLSDLLLHAFTVDAKSVPAWYKLYFELPWQRAYTLNVDDLPRAANEAFKLPRRIVSLSATSQGKAVNEPRQSRFDFVHLNGDLEDVPERVTFSVTQYADRSRTDPWYIRFTADLVTSPVVFVGTKLEEPPLWLHLVLRHSRGGRELTELRHRSYLVTPSLDLAKQALLAQYNVVWLEMDAETFAKEILVQLEAAGKEGHQVLSSAVEDRDTSGTLSEVAELAINPGESSEFLMGSEPIWADIQSGRAIQRAADESLWTLVRNRREAEDVKGVLVITGTAGSGKTASIKRLCLRLIGEGVRVGWVDRNLEIAPAQIRSAMRLGNPPPILAIDDADMYGSELSRMIRDISLTDGHPLVIVGVRSGRVDRVLNPAVLEGIPQIERVMPHLEDSDITMLIDVLERERRLGILTKKTRSEQIQAFRDEAGRQLLVAMIRATSGKDLKDKAFEELGDLEGQAQIIYSIICLASAFRFELFRDEILIACRDTTNAALNTLNQLIQRHIVTAGRNGAVSSRHRVIAELVRDELQKRGHLKPAVEGLALLAATKVNQNLVRSARPWRMLKHFINHEFLVQSCGRESARNLYGDLEDLLAWDYHFWLQRGSLELEYGEIKLAEHFLATAKGLGENDSLVQTEWAYLLFKKAIDELGVEAPKLVAEATSILEDLMNRVGDAYPYHILGSQGLSWARRGITSSREKEKYLRRLTALLDEGCRKYPKEKELKTLLDDLKKAYLNIAVSKSVK